MMDEEKKSDRPKRSLRKLQDEGARIFLANRTRPAALTETRGPLLVRLGLLVLYAGFAGDFGKDFPIAPAVAFAAMGLSWALLSGFEERHGARVPIGLRAWNIFGLQVAFVFVLLPVIDPVTRWLIDTLVTATVIGHFTYRSGFDPHKLPRVVLPEGFWPLALFILLLVVLPFMLCLFRDMRKDERIGQSAKVSGLILFSMLFFWPIFLGKLNWNTPIASAGGTAGALICYVVTRLTLQYAKGYHRAFLPEKLRADLIREEALLEIQLAERREEAEREQSRESKSGSASATSTSSPSAEHHGGGE